ncbi:MAG: PBP1A family penicillin-binding protein [bacterium]
MAKSDSGSKKSFFSRILKFFKWLAIGGVIAIAVVLVAGYAFYLHVSKDLPKLDKIEDYRPPIMAEVFDDSGKKIGEFWTEARILTPIDKIPKKMIQGFVASEDDRFFQHGGVDPYGILRAFITNLQAGHVVQGASTITQQVTKALLLSPERTYDRKIKEAILATRIERNLTKDQILYIYLNQTFFGNRAYGVAAAARNYFHKNLDELNIAEIALIVGLAKAPSLFNPLVNPTRAVQRQHYVIDRMQDEGYITAAEAKEAKAFPLRIYEAGTDKDFNKKYAPYFVEHVRRALQKKYGNELYTGGWKIYTTANLEMNQEAQKAVRDGLDQYAKRFGYRGPVEHLDSPEKIQAFLNQQHLELLREKEDIDDFSDPGHKRALAKPAPLEADRRYQAVITEVGDRGLKVRVAGSEGFISREDMAWAKTPARGAQPWEPAVGDVVEVKVKGAAASKAGKPSAITTVSNAGAFILDQSPEVQSAIFSYEPFSGAIKAIVGGQDFNKSEFNRATQALRQPGSSIKPLIYAAALDKGYTPATVIMDSPIVYEESPGKFWKPKNYGGKYYGPTAFRNALVNSRNVVTVRILMDIGTHYVTAFMRKLGLSTPVFKYYSMALGANDVLLEELATAYGTFVTGGIKPKTHFVEKIVDPKGQVVEQFQPPTTPFLISYQALKEGDKADRPAKPEGGPESTASAESRPESMPMGSGQKSIEEMGFREDLMAAAEQATKDDQLNLTDYEKKVLYGDYIPPGYTITPKTAMTMVSILRDVVRAGTGTRALALQKPAAGKTGTTNGETDCWFIGFTPDLVTGVWVGFDEKIKTLGHGATGGTVAAPIWLLYMKEATKRYVTKDFTIPSWIDLSVYGAPIQVVQGGGDAEMGDAGAGTGVAASGNAGGGGGGGGAEFFTKDLE